MDGEVLDDPLLRHVPAHELPPDPAAAEDDHPVAEECELLVVAADAQDVHATLLHGGAEELEDLLAGAVEELLAEVAVEAGHDGGRAAVEATLEADHALAPRVGARELDGVLNQIADGSAQVQPLALDADARVALDRGVGADLVDAVAGRGGAGHCHG